MNSSGQNKNQFKTFFIPISLTIVFVISMIWFNVYQRSSRYSQEGDQFLSEGKTIEAISSFEAAAHAYTPWNSHVRHSMEKLWEIGEKLEQEHEDPTYALIAFRSLRSSVYAIRSFYMPYKEWIPQCDRKIRDLVSIQNYMIEDAARQANETAD